MFTVKDFETLHTYKIREQIEPSEISAKYFFCLDNKMLFIKKSRKYYQVIASCQCGFEPAFRLGVLDVLYENADLNEVVNMFKSYCLRLL